MDWLNNTRVKLDEPHSPSLGKLLADYYDGRNAGAWSNKAKVSNLKRLSSAITYLEEKGLHTIADLEARLDSLHSSLDEIKTTLDANKKRSKELRELLRYAGIYKRFKPLHDRLRAELTKLLYVKYCVDRALSAREDKGRKTRLLRLYVFCPNLTPSIISRSIWIWTSWI